VTFVSTAVGAAARKGLQASARSVDRGDVRQAFGAAVGLFLALVGTLADVRADELSDLEKAYAAYAAHKYVDAEERLRALLDPKIGTLKDPDRVADARMYLGAVLLAEGRRPDALGVFQRLLLDKEDYQPDPLRVPLEALDALIDVRSQIRETVRALQVERARHQQDEQAKLDAERQRAAARVAVLEKLAGEEIVIERSSRLIALLPLGVGQFQNRQDTLGWAFLVSESLLAAGSAISAGLTLYNEANANGSLQQGDTLRANGYEGRAKGDWAADAAFEHVQVRRRVLPSLSLAPAVGPGGVGVIGRF
jgi:hypothetical protein